MGLDTTIYFRARDDFSSNALENYMPNGFDVTKIPDYCHDDYPDATHELDTCHRYYGEGYERGPWPHIAAALMILFATEGVERVWYGSDCEGPSEIKPEDVLKTCAHYMAKGCRPYRGRFLANSTGQPRAENQ
jgi:hypothetical protein